MGGIKVLTLLRIIVDKMINLLNLIRRIVIQIDYLLKIKTNRLINKNSSKFTFPRTEKPIIIVGHGGEANLRFIREKRNDFFIISAGNINQILNMQVDLVVFGEDTFTEDSRKEIITTLEEAIHEKTWVYLPVGLRKIIESTADRNYLENPRVFSVPRFPFLINEVKTKIIRIDWTKPIFANLRHTELMVMLAICSGTRNIHLEGCNTDFLSLYLDRKYKRFYHFFDSTTFDLESNKLYISEKEFKKFLAEQSEILQSLHKINEYAKSKQIRITTNENSSLSFLEIQKLEC